MKKSIIVLSIFLLALSFSAFAGMPTNATFVVSYGTHFWVVCGDMTNLLFSSTNMNRAAKAVTNDGTLAQFTVVSNSTPATGALLRYDGTRWVPTSSVVESSPERSTNDFVVGMLTTDGTTNSISVAASHYAVPAGAKTVVLRVGIKDDVVNQFIQFRKTGGDWKHAPPLYTQVANQQVYGQFEVFLDSSRAFEYRTSNNAFTIINIQVLSSNH